MVTISLCILWIIGQEFLQAGSCTRGLLDRGGYTKWSCLEEVPHHEKKRLGGRNGRILMVSNTLIQQQQQQSLSSKTLELAMDSQYTNSGRGHVLFSGILSYLNSYSLGFLPPSFFDN